MRNANFRHLLWRWLLGLSERPKKAILVNGVEPGLAMLQDRRPSGFAASSDALPLTVAGFGACMIAGYPYQNGGLFEVACNFVEKKLSRSVQSHIVTLAGFPAPRAANHLKQKVFKFEPDYVVIQFGATDAQCPIRAKNRVIGCRSKPGVGKAVYHAPTRFTMARWEIVSLMGFLRKADAITPLCSYIEAIGRMVDECVSAGITPVILSPFVFGSRYSTGNAILYTNALHELHSRVRGMIFVDCIQLLSMLPKSMILLSDGFHLSSVAHNLIGEAIGKAIVADAVRVDPQTSTQDRASQERADARALS